MPIEDLGEEMQNDKIVVQKQDVFAQNNIVIAGFTVKHPLFDCKLQVIGFTDYYPSDGENIVMKGMSYRIPGYKWDNHIYPKLVIDLKQNTPKAYLDTECEVPCNYYIYENIHDTKAHHFYDQIYAVCKYKEDGKLMHGFFNLHEITPDI